MVGFVWLSVGWDGSLIRGMDRRVCCRVMDPVGNVGGVMLSGKGEGSNGALSRMVSWVELSGGKGGVEMMGDLEVLAEEASKRGDEKRAKEIVEWMRRCDLTPVEKVMLWVVRASRNDTELMLSLFEDMKAMGGTPNIFVYNAIISGLGGKGKMNRVAEFLRAMNDANVKPDTVTYNALMKGYAESGNLAGAVAIFNQMREKNIYRSTVTFSTMMDTYIRHRAFPSVLAVFDEMVKCNVQLNSVAYSNLIHAFAKQVRPSTKHLPEKSCFFLFCFFLLSSTSASGNLSAVPACSSPSAVSVCRNGMKMRRE